MPRILLTLLVCSGTLFGQSVTGSIVGAVRDTSGGLVPNAEIRVTNKQTQFTWNTRSTSSGDYEVPSLPPGEYGLTASITGFQRASVSGISLSVNRVVRVEIVLQPGTVTETVEVVAGVQVVSTDNATVGSVLENKIVSEVPLNGRNVDRLLKLMAGVSTDSPSNPRVAGSAYWGGTKFTVDGMSYNDSANGGSSYTGAHGLATLPSLDAISEFKVDASSQKAEYEGSASVVVVTKSGGNAFHGSAFEYNRNKSYAARNATATGLAKPPFNRNEFGASLGGPVRRNQTFFFGYYEGLRERSPRTNLLSVATAGERSGDFTGLGSLRDPLSGLPFANNRIPESRIDARAKTLLDYVPLPNLAGLGAAGTLQNMVVNVPQVFDIDRAGGRIDHRISAKDSLWFVYTHSKGSPYFFANPYPAQYGHRENGGFSADNPNLTYTRIISPSTTNDFRAGYFYHVRDAYGTNRSFDATKLFPDLFGPLPEGGLPTMAINGHVGIGDYGGNTTRYYTTQFIDNVSHIRGAHTFKAGVDLAVDRVSRPPAVFGLGSGVAGSAGLGVFSFDGRYTVVSGAAQPEHSFADYLLGLPFRTQRASPSAVNLYHQTRVSAYLQDDWKASSRLTLNLGVRYMVQTAWKERDGAMANLDLSTSKLVVAGRSLPPQSIPRLVSDYDVRVKGSDVPLLNTDTNNVAPRFGFAYRVTSDARTVVRGGFGIFYNTVPLNVGILQLGFSNPPFLLSETFDASPGSAPSLTLAKPFLGTGAVTSSPTINAADPNMVNSLSYQWNVTVEREVWSKLALRTSYVGSRISHLNWYNYNLNHPAEQRAGALQLQRPYQPWGQVNYASSGGDSSFHSFQMEAVRRYSQGLTFELNYAWNRNLDNVPISSSPQNPYRADLDRGNSEGVRRHIFTLAHSYELPFGPGKRWLARSGTTGAIVGGWQLAGITILQSGTPLSVSFTSTVTGWASGRADLIGDPRLGRSERGEVKWFNTSAFRTPQPFLYGNSARNLLFGPGQMIFDVSLLKNFTIGDRFRVQLRAESFNFPNHRNWGNPSTNVTTPATFGRLGGAGDPRQVQFGGKFLF